MVRRIAPTCSPGRAKPWASSTPSRGRTGRKPMARPSASFRPASGSGPTAASGATARNEPRGCPRSSPITSLEGLTRLSATSLQLLALAGTTYCNSTTNPHDARPPRRHSPGCRQRQPLRQRQIAASPGRRNAHGAGRRPPAAPGLRSRPRRGASGQRGIGGAAGRSRVRTGCQRSLPSGHGPQPGGGRPRRAGCRRLAHRPGGYALPRSRQLRPRGGGPAGRGRHRGARVPRAPGTSGRLRQAMGRTARAPAGRRRGAADRGRLSRRGGALRRGRSRDRAGRGSRGRSGGSPPRRGAGTVSVTHRGLPVLKRYAAAEVCVVSGNRPDHAYTPATPWSWLHLQGEEFMNLKIWLILSALVAGTNVWAADTPAAKPAEGASTSMHKAEESAKKTAAEAKEAAQKATNSAKVAMDKAELAVGNTSQNAAEAARQAAKAAEKAAQYAAHTAAEATRKATAAPH